MIASSSSAVLCSVSRTREVRRSSAETSKYIRNALAATNSQPFTSWIMSTVCGSWNSVRTRWSEAAIHRAPNTK